MATSYGRISVDFDFFGFDADRRRLRQPTGQVTDTPEDRGGRADDPCIQPNRPWTDLIGEKSGDGHGNHHSGPGPGLDGGEHSAPEIVRDVAEELGSVQHGTYRDRGSGQCDEHE